MRVRSLLVAVAVTVGLALAESPAGMAAPAGSPTTSAAQEAKKGSWPTLQGSFIQPPLIDGWSDGELAAELAMLKQAGINQVVLNWTSDTKTSVAEAIYPTSVPGHRQATKTDVLGRLLKAADKAKIEVFVGLQLNLDWFLHLLNDSAWLNTETDQGIALASDVWRKYGSHRSFRGWYLPFEVTNFGIDTEDQLTRLTTYYSRTVAHLKSLNPTLPVAIAPYYVPKYAMQPSAWEAVWTRVLAAAPIDIIALQDGVGAENTTIDDIAPWFAATRRAVDTRPGTRLYTDTETFIIKYWASMPISQIVADMRAAQPYVSGYWAFAYDHYQSPLVVTSSFDAAYQQYVKTGKLEQVPPTRPSGLKATPTGPLTVQLTWNAPPAADGVAAYIIYRDGRDIARIATPKNCTTVKERLTCSAAVPPTKHQLSGLEPERSYQYAIRAVDATGNVSVLSDVATATQPLAPPTPNVLSLGKGYTCSPSPSSWYADTNGVELTDGVHAAAVFTDPAWQGHSAAGTLTCTVDLGSARTINEVRSTWLQEGPVGISLPGEVEVLISQDGSSFTSIGKSAKPGVDASTQIAPYRVLGLDVAARYVRFVATGLYGWGFVDEFEVRAYA